MDQVFAPRQHPQMTAAFISKKGQSDTGKEREGKREKVCKFDYINTFPLHSFIYNKYIY